MRKKHKIHDENCHDKDPTKNRLWGLFFPKIALFAKKGHFSVGEAVYVLGTMVLGGFHENHEKWPKIATFGHFSPSFCVYARLLPMF